MRGHVGCDSIYLKCAEQVNPRQKADRWVLRAGGHAIGFGEVAAGVGKGGMHLKTDGEGATVAQLCDGAN